MRKTSLLGAAVASLALMAGIAGYAQPYSNAVQALNPSAYWPLTETTQPPSGYYVATNRGTAGALANGFYQTWYQPSGTSFYPTNYILRTPGPIADGDAAMLCLYDKGPGQYVVFPRYTNGVANPAVTLQPPFSIELWVYSGNTNHGLNPFVNEGRNAVQGDASANPPYTNTFRGLSLGQYKNYFYFQLYKAIRNDNNGVPELDVKFVTTNTWYHLVATYDGTNAFLYTNGVQAATATASYVPDLVSPLLIGTGTEISSGGAVTYDGGLDEVAIYPTALTVGQISAHYTAASGAGYPDAVLADSPSIYLRLDEPPMTSYPSPSTYPVANNYGSLGAAANGLYQPGTVPGVAGPPFAGFGASSRAVAINGFYGGVDVGGGSLPADLNPTNRQSFTITTWFQGNPADAPARFQEIVGHSDSSWRLAMGGGTGNNNNNPADIHFNPGPGPELQFANLADVLTNNFRFNDGNWHMAAGVCDGASEYLYLDGVLAKSNTLAGNIVGSALDVIIGGDPQYMAPSANSAKLRLFNGQVAQVAFFTNALSPAQLQQLYGAAGVPLTIVGQPQSTTNDAGSSLTLSVQVRGSAPVYQWYKNNSAVPGAANATLTFNPLALSDAGNYYVVITSANSSLTSSIAQVTVNGPPVAQSQSPTDVKVFVGTTPSLRVAVTGPPPYSYQWSKNGSPISGATASSYVPSTTSVGSSTYTCTVTNAYGTVTFKPITVGVQSAPTAPYPASVLGDRPMTYFRLDEVVGWGGTDGQTAYDYAGGLNGAYTNTYPSQPGYTSQTDPDTGALFGSNPDGVDSFAGNVSPFLSFATINGASAAFSVEAWVNGDINGQTATAGAGMVTLGYGNGGEQFNLDTGAAGGKYRFFVRTAADPANAKVVNGTNAPNDGFWHHVVGVCDQANGRLYLYVDGVQTASSTVATNTGLINLTAPLSIGSRKSGQNTAYDAQFKGSVDEVALYNYPLSAAQIQAHYVAAGVAPRILVQPLDVTTNEGATVTLSVAAVGTAPLTYQWVDNNYSPIPDGTNATLVLTNVQVGQSGYYFVTVANAYGSVSSANPGAHLTVNGGVPNIDVDLQPLSSTNYAGTPFTYSVSVSGTAPFRYQWYKNGTAVAGATGSSYSFTTATGTSTYYVAVTNAWGYAISSTATNVGVAAPSLNPADYTYKMKITFPGYNRGETLADFPVLVKFGTNLSGFGYQQMASATGGDLRFTDASGTRQIPHEIDEWNPTGTSVVWVQVPRLAGTNDPASTNNYMWAYWGNPAATTPLAWSTNGSVWVPQPFEGLPAYQLVWHLKESGLPYADSAQQYPALTGTAPVPTAGIIGTAGTFDGAASFLDAGVETNIDGAFTLSAWVNLSTAANNIQTIWANKVGGWNANGFALYVNSWQSTDQQLRFENGNGTTGNTMASASGTVTYGQWHLVTAAIDRANGAGRLYMDGNDVTASGAVIKDFGNMSDVNLGRLTTSGSYFNGALDEVRIQTGTNSANYVWASYMTVAQNATFQNYASIISSAVSLTFQVVNGQLVLSWPQGTLQVANQVNDTYTDVTTATSPYSVPLSASQKFYRIKVR